MGNPARLIAALSALAADAAARPLPPVNLTEAAVRGDLDAVRAFLDGGAELEQRTIGFASPLAAAAGRGHLDVAELLVARGASLDPEASAFPLLAFPIANRRLDVVERLLKAGAPVAKYRSHFRLAAKNGQWDMVDAMLAGGADPGWLSDAERAPLDAALQTPAAQRKRAQVTAPPAPEPAPDPVVAAAAAEEVEDMGHDIAGQVFAATGSFESLTQTEIQMNVEIRGGVYASAVTKKTSALIAGAKAGAKLEKAKAQGVRILTEAQFHVLLEQIPIMEGMKRRYLG